MDSYCSTLTTCYTFQSCTDWDHLFHVITVSHIDGIYSSFINCLSVSQLPCQKKSCLYISCLFHSIHLPLSSCFSWYHLSEWSCYSKYCVLRIQPNFWNAAFLLHNFLLGITLFLLSLRFYSSGPHLSILLPSAANLLKKSLFLITSQRGA